MGMQVSSLIMGNAPAPQEFPQEKRAPLPGDPKPVLEQFDAFLSGGVGNKVKVPDLKQATADLEHISLAFNRRLKFEINQESREILVKVIDNETDKVIKVLPPEELQRLHSRIRETIGFLFDRLV